VDAPLDEESGTSDAGLAGGGKDPGDGFTALSMWASAKTMLGDFPPSSIVTCFIWPAAWK
jgi:hypothetical protein